MGGLGMGWRPAPELQLGFSLQVTYDVRLTGRTHCDPSSSSHRLVNPRSQSLFLKL